MISKQIAQKIYVDGLKSGYKRCCIEAFIIDCNNDIPPAVARIGLNGFVPCRSCQDIILNDIDKRVLELLTVDNNNL